MDPILLAHIISVITTAIAVVTLQLRNMRIILLGQIIANGLVAAQYLLEGTISAAGICAAAIIQVTVGYFFSSKGKPFPKWLTAVFVLVYTVIAVITYRTPFDIFSYLASLTFAISMVQSRSSVCRILLVFNNIFWIACAVGTGAYSPVIMNTTLLVTTVIGIIRLDREDWRTAIARLKGREKRDDGEKQENF